MVNGKSEKSKVVSYLPTFKALKAGAETWLSVITWIIDSTITRALVALTVDCMSTLLLVIVVRVIVRWWRVSCVDGLTFRMRSMRGTVWRLVRVGRSKGRWDLPYVAATGHLTGNHTLLNMTQ